MNVRAHRILTAPEIAGLNRSALLVLCKILAHLHEQSGEARPSIKRLTRATGLSERTVQRAINDLTDAGLMEVSRGGGRNRASVYRFKNPVNNNDAVSSAKPRQQSDTVFPENPDTQVDGVSEQKSRHSEAKTPSKSAQNPVNAADTPTEERRNGGARKRDPLWHAVVETFRLTPATESDKRRIGKVVGDLRAKGATADEVPKRTTRYRKAWPRVPCTPEAMTKHWETFAEPAGVLDAEPVEPPDEIFSDG
jgi:DNA-binding transcriptional ArsR family regulator